MYSALRPLLFKLNPEIAHELSLDALSALERLKLISALAPKDMPALPCEVMGLKFANPVGLAAGLDKNASCYNAMGALGFGFVEVGTVTPRAQPGNDKPRMFRLEDDEAIINRMGFNNLGLANLVNNLRSRRYRGILGVNLGKNKTTPEEHAVDDYIAGMRAVYSDADYLTINISSPNTPGLRDLQFGEALKTLVSGIMQVREQLADTHGKRVPVAVKLAPDSDYQNLKQIVDTLLEAKIEAIIATNTTLSRDGLRDRHQAQESGGLSGAPLTQRSTEVIAHIAEHSGGALPIIGVGGIMSGQDAVDKINAGASLVQLYTGFIYRGPDLIREVLEALQSR